ncbi:MAG: HAD-IA family hydrolase [Candidatus Roizmanbacteria bacterium]|nr:HAD-IA family hydrolase [Candidatus Roizmanbacteria bacterium]
MKKSFDSLIFDMDGVLVDVRMSYRKAIKKTAEYFLKRKIKDEEVNSIKQRVGMNNDWDATYELINNIKIPYREVKDMFQRIYLGVGSEKGLIDNETLLISKNDLSRLKNIYGKLGIATGRPKEEAQYVLDRFELKELFDVVVTKEDTQKEKPYPDPILKAIKVLGVKKSVYIGDSPSDVVAATAAGIPILFVGENKEATICFSSILDVVDYLV